MHVSSSKVLPLISLLALLSLAACSSSKGVEADDPDVITEDEIHETNAVSLNELIARRSPGVSIEETADGRINAVIRGRNTFTGNESPLYVVDGIPVDPMSDGSLPGVVLSEIEKIEVLKSPAETARWGMRGANGVIMVTTKKGNSN